jgi:predicted nucleotidyltransferase component of viral defense system
MTVDSLATAEAFHLAFLSALQSSAGHDRFALKGGGNLRFFYRSLRYSEDIDLDVFVVDPRRFAPKMDRAIGSRATERLLSVLDIQISSRTMRERSTTREKWEVVLAHGALEQAVRTRVDLSFRNRDALPGVAVEPVPAEVMTPYAPLVAPVVGHYLPEAAIEQKIYALKERAEHGNSQPRDVFDLDLLLRGHPSVVHDRIVPSDIAAQAAERALEMTWPEFRSKVVAYLEPDVAVAFDTPAAWSQMQDRVVTVLMELTT